VSDGAPVPVCPKGPHLGRIGPSEIVRVSATLLRCLRPRLATTYLQLEFSEPLLLFFKLTGVGKSNPRGHSAVSADAAPFALSRIPHKVRRGAEFGSNLGSLFRFLFTQADLP